MSDLIWWILAAGVLSSVSKTLAGLWFLSALAGIITFIFRAVVSDDRDYYDVLPALDRWGKRFLVLFFVFVVAAGFIPNEKYMNAAIATKATSMFVETFDVDDVIRRSLAAGQE